MASCKECMHENVCKVRHFPSLFGLTGDDCDFFKNKADFVEVKHGYWIDDSIPMHTNSYFKCSVCEGHDDQEYDYCHHCGAKMDGKEGAEG